MNEQITNLSKGYLESFLKFCETKKIESIIVGGWAVWAYTKTDYSVDIDLVLKNKKELEKIGPFFEENGFKPDINGGVSFFKQVFEKGIGEYSLKEIIFDITFNSDKNTLQANKKIDIPWKLVEKNTQKTTFEGIPIVIPTVELLLIFKTKALIDREHLRYKLQGFEKSLSRKRREFKIEKDKKDIRNLLATQPVNQERLDQLLKKTKFKNLFDEKIKEIQKQI
ncbi:MAG: hypothetical protein Q7R47_02040 [Candidatus Diapherotrites archaeon]|nr:hypothetical protein [Candidatus Diapherotrites archaeon]